MRQLLRSLSACRPSAVVATDTLPRLPLPVPPTRVGLCSRPASACRPADVRIAGWALGSERAVVAEWAELGWLVALAGAGGAMGTGRPRPAPETALAARTVTQVRGMLAERVVVSTALDLFLTLKAAADYTGLSVKTLRRAINDMPDRALPCYRVGAVILVRRSEVDAWLAQRRMAGRPSLVAAARALGLAKAY